ncbi:ABC transporter ATP-binding protein [Roseibium sp.]|uniref:ABC transporter ATP-binding protein n=1 Tax=Roseibium sp. TaxID=1936156 RepID=UPI003B501FBE
MAEVRLQNVSKTFGEVDVLKSVSLDVRDGEFLTLIGASGCGKSTLLRIIAGLEAQTSGTVTIGSRGVDHLRPKDRRIAMVFQSYALYPHMTVAQNMATPLEIDRCYLAERLPLLRLLSPRRKRLQAEIREDVLKTAEQLKIEPLLGRRPSQLSGGQRQRVALGRAMVRQPDVFLMDEPLSNLDASLRVHMRKELAALHAELGATFIYVTHDQVEAMTMSDRVALMEAGEVLQVGAPHELYQRPANTRVAAFLGSPKINLLDADADVSGALSLFGQPLSVEAGPGAKIGLRPEAVILAAPQIAGSVAGRLVAMEDLGHETVLDLDVDGKRVTLRTTANAITAARDAGWIGDNVFVKFDLSQLLVFDGDGNRIETAEASAPAQAAAQ